ncbi:MAG: NTP transferase domain-containing protein [Planctomycetes bacterium]|nr:NTP transferase domain-containing protein [Planctomycetota bacterium]
MADGLARLDEACQAAFVCACDVPFITVAFVTRLVDLLGNADAVVPTVGGRRHPLSAVYRVGVATEIARLLDRGNRSMNTLLDRIDVRSITPSGWADLNLPFDPLRNLNTLADYRRAVRDLNASGPPT